jgi:drug/metabolite transporter (DMT)-like permease
MNRFPLTLLLILTTAVWGWTFSAVKEAIDAYCVIGFLAVRFAIGSASLGIVAARRITARSLVVGGLIGILVAVAHLLQTFGLRYTTATNCGLITGLFAVFGILANRILFGVRILPVFWAAAGLSLVGLYLLTGAGPSPPTLGDLLTLGCAVGFGLQIAFLDRFAQQHDPIALTFAQIASATVIFLLVWPLSEPVAWPSVEVWSALAVTGVLATAGGFYVQVLAQQQLPASRAAIILTLEPVFATLFGFLLAGDRLTGIQFTGAILMFAAVGVIEIFSAERRAILVQEPAAPGRS